MSGWRDFALRGLFPRGVTEWGREVPNEFAKPMPVLRERT
jgi:hypothetical protein